MRGGDKTLATNLFATPKAMTQYRELGGHLSREMLCKTLQDIELQLLGDDSPYWIVHLEGIRFVCCVAHRHQFGDGWFTIVTVQVAYDKTAR